MDYHSKKVFLLANIMDMGNDFNKLHRAESGIKVAAARSEATLVGTYTCIL